MALMKKLMRKARHENVDYLPVYQVMSNEKVRLHIMPLLEGEICFGTASGDYAPNRRFNICRAFEFSNLIYLHNLYEVVWLLVNDKPYPDFTVLKSAGIQSNQFKHWRMIYVGVMPSWALNGAVDFADRLRDEETSHSARKLYRAHDRDLH